MKSVVITGSSSGLGLEMAKKFRTAGYHLVLNGTKAEKLEAAKETLQCIDGSGEIYTFAGNVSSVEDLQKLVDFAAEQCGASTSGSTMLVSTSR